MAFNPLVGALAAGCVAVIKLPESLTTLTPLLAALVAKYLDPGVVRVVQGAIDEMTAVRDLLDSFDAHSPLHSCSSSNGITVGLSSKFYFPTDPLLVFFTGSPKVGRIVATAAAKHVTPVTLELGGKCPVVVDPHNADYNLIARRILWGRTTNSGQVCIGFCF